MAFIKRHKNIFAFGICILLMSAGAWLVISHIHSTPASAGDTPTGEGGQAVSSMDPAVYSQIQQLRSKFFLRNQDLAAMGCTQQEAAAVLQSIVTWYETNKTALDTKWQAKAEAATALRKVMRKINMGPRDEEVIAQVPSLRNAYYEAVKDENDLAETIVSAVSARLSDSQKSTWEAARNNAGLPSEFLYVANISDEQRSSLCRAYRSRVRKAMLAETTEKQTEAAEAYETALENALSADQESAVTASKTAINTNLPGVIEAEREILPLPEEFEQDVPVEQPVE